MTQDDKITMMYKLITDDTELVEMLAYIFEKDEAVYNILRDDILFNYKLVKGYDD